jgi:LysM repeat protein
VAADTATSKTVYTVALDVSYEDALDARSQLALGTLQLERTSNAVTGAEAAALLPLWRVLASGELQGDGETHAVLKQIEATMTADQVSAIARLRLTQEDAQAWLEETGSAQAAAASTGEGQAFAGGRRPEGMEDVSDEEREQIREQMLSASEGSAQIGKASFGGSQSMALTRAVVELLITQIEAADKATSQPPAGQAVGQATGRESTGAAETCETTELPAADESSIEAEFSTKAESSPAVEDAVATESLAAEPDSVQGTALATADEPESVVYVVRARNSLAAIAAAYGVTVEAIAEANEIEDPNTIYIGQALVIVEPGRIPESGVLTPSALVLGVKTPIETEATVTAPALWALEQSPDNDPGPPFTVQVSANRATEDPLVEKSQTYLVTGIVRNDGDQTYAVSKMGVTFYDAEGFRGTYDPAVRDGKIVSAEWNWHGQTEAEFAALLLAPGEEWPFSVEITAQDMASFTIHPDAAPTGRESALVALSDVRVVKDGTGYVQIRGTATNVNAFAVENVTVSGVLFDGSGQIVSVGSTYALQESIKPGESLSFVVRVEEEPYAKYQLYAQAERDW